MRHGVRALGVGVGAMLEKEERLAQPKQHTIAVFSKLFEILELVKAM